MGNRQSANSVPCDYHSYEMINPSRSDTHHSEGGPEKKSLFSIFHVPKKEDIGIIIQPLTGISTSEYNAVFQIAFSRMQEQNTRENQGIEDAVFIKEYEKDSDKLFIASVLDGHQGTDTLNFVIANLFDSLATKLFENPENLEDEIKEIFQHVDSLYCEEKAEQLLSITHPKKSCIPCFSRTPDSHQENLYLGCGCVLTLLCVYNNKLIVAGLGDCGVCFSIGGRSSYSLKRHDLNDASERQRIKDAGAQVEDNRINGMLEVSRSFGDVWFKQSYHQRRNEIERSKDIVTAEPEIEIYPLSNDVEFCIIGSDGIFSIISYQTAITIVKDCILKGRSGEDACRELIQRCRKKTDDDISVVILFFHISEHTKYHQVIDADTLADSRCYSDGEDDHTDTLPAISPDVPSYCHSISEISLSMYLTRQSCREPKYAGLCDVFNRDKDETPRVSIGPSVSKELT